MVLYHFSNGKYNKLVPRLGTKGLSLTNNPNVFFENEDGSNFYKYRYRIKLDRNSPYLHSDDKFNIMLKRYNRAFKSKRAVSKWFFYNNSLEYVGVSEWNSKLAKFS